MIDEVRVTLQQPVVSVTVYRIDGVMVLNAVSSLDRAEFDLAEGEGTRGTAMDLGWSGIRCGGG